MVESKKIRGKSKIINLLRREPWGVSLEEFHKETELSKPTILYHLTKLKKN